MSRGIAYAGDFDFEGNTIKFEIDKDKIVVGNGIYFIIKDGKLTRYENNGVAGTYTAGESIEKISSRINIEESVWEDGVFNYDDLTVENTEEQEDVYNENGEIYEIQNKYLKAIQDYSGSELNDITPDKNIENFEYPESEKGMQETLNDFKKILQEVYGSDVEISYEQSSFEEFDIIKLNNALNDEEDVDTIESLNKTIKDVIKTGCNLQRCVKSDMTFTISGKKKEDTQMVSSYVYKVDEEYYIDTHAFLKLFQGQKRALEEKHSGNSDYSTADLNIGYSGDEEMDYSSLLIKYE